MARDELGFDEAARRRRWKRVRTSVTLLVLVGVVVGGAWYSWQSVIEQEAEPTTRSTNVSCAPGVPTAAPAAVDIQLNVYNSTDRNGLASSVARQMRERGFSVVDVANDPLDKTIEGTAEVRSHIDQQAAASLVASMVPGAAYVSDDRTDATVDLVLGVAFEALTPPGAPPATPPAGLPPCEPPAE